MSQLNEFVFADYIFNQDQKTLELKYAFSDRYVFSEIYKFNFDLIDYPKEALDKAIQILFFTAGVSYYKAFVGSNIQVLKGNIDEYSAGFYSRTYQKGLGEFFYVNNLSPATKINFPLNSDDLEPKETISNHGLLVGLGGGKDSLVVVEALRDKEQDLTTWSMNYQSQLEPLVNKIDLNHLYVERTIDPKIIELNNNGALNGHVPISAILAACGVVVAVLSGKRDVVVGNEHSANEETLNYDGVSINHQYSKSEEFEIDFSNLLNHNFNKSIRYYSFLRPLSEIRIAEMFAKELLDKYLGVFSSCNRAYTMTSDHMFWCGECSKCAFIFLALTPFCKRTKLESIWGGKNLLLDKNLESTYKNILGISGAKPLDCVGEIKESRSAMKLAQEIYPELKDKYIFDLPNDYNYKNLYSHQMPDEMFDVLKNFIDQY